MYKRQGFEVVDLAVIFDDDIELIKAVHPNIYVASSTSHGRVWDDPVSYTHLDVYKRQILSSFEGVPVSSANSLRRDSLETEGFIKNDPAQRSLCGCFCSRVAMVSRITHSNSFEDVPGVSVSVVSRITISGCVLKKLIR